MRMIMIAVTVVLATLASASAGLPTIPDRPPALAHATPRSTAAPESVNPLTTGDVSRIEGIDVYGNDGKLGQVSTVLIDPQTKKIDRLVVAAGGVLGIDGHRVAIPIDQFKWEPDKGAFRLAATTASLRSMPEWINGADTASGSSLPPRQENSTGAGDGDKTSK